MHRLDPRMKILLTVAFIVGRLPGRTALWGYALALAFVYFMARACRHVPVKMLLQGPQAPAVYR